MKSLWWCEMARVFLLLPIIVILFGMSTPCYAAGNVLNKFDYILEYSVTGQSVEVGKKAELPGAVTKADYDELGRIAGLTVYSSEYVTHRGQKVGDTLDSVKVSYGEPSASGYRPEYYWMTYKYQDTSSSLKIHFYVNQSNNRVIVINLNLYPVGAPPLIRLSN